MWNVARTGGDDARPDPARSSGARRSKAPWITAMALALVAAAGCDDAIGPDARRVHARLDVAGGFAGVDYAIEVDGRDLVVRGIRCRAGCDFADGQVLLGISADQVTAMAAQLEDAGVLQNDGRNFGVECCDQLVLALDYERGSRAARLSGSSGALPSPIARAMQRLHALSEKRLATIVAFGSSPDDWPADPLTIDAIVIDGSDLAIDATWGGGCEAHSIDLVFWNGFLESNPVQAHAVLAHDARNDMCDALIRDTRRFDLEPLRDRWQEFYGQGPGTIIIRIDPPGAADPLTLTYTF